METAISLGLLRINEELTIDISLSDDLKGTTLHCTYGSLLGLFTPNQPFVGANMRLDGQLKARLRRKEMTVSCDVSPGIGPNLLNGTLFIFSEKNPERDILIKGILSDHYKDSTYQPDPDGLAQREIALAVRYRNEWHEMQLCRITEISAFFEGSIEVEPGDFCQVRWFDPMTFEPKTIEATIDTCQPIEGEGFIANEIEIIYPTLSPEDWNSLLLWLGRIDTPPLEKGEDDSPMLDSLILENYQPPPSENHPDQEDIQPRHQEIRKEKQRQHVSRLKLILAILSLIFVAVTLNLYRSPILPSTYETRMKETSPRLIDQDEIIASRKREVLETNRHFQKKSIEGTVVEAVSFQAEGAMISHQHKFDRPFGDNPLENARIQEQFDEIKRRKTSAKNNREKRILEIYEARAKMLASGRTKR